MGSKYRHVYIVCVCVFKSDQEGEDDEAADRSVQAAVKQAPKKRPPKKTVEQNLSNINLSESEMRCEVMILITAPRVQHWNRFMGHGEDGNSGTHEQFFLLSSRWTRCSSAWRRPSTRTAQPASSSRSSSARTAAASSVSRPT